mmetsp:Transcript_12828/g.32395  ORF Transcript_12828/g.32395 Transcript_12828/m.32395 type:complete len:240 (+) Transcript_12828:935-1654(+)
MRNLLRARCKRRTHLCPRPHPPPLPESWGSKCWEISTTRLSWSPLGTPFIGLASRGTTVSWSARPAAGRTSSCGTWKRCRWTVCWTCVRPARWCGTWRGALTRPSLCAWETAARPTCGPRNTWRIGAPSRPGSGSSRRTKSTWRRRMSLTMGRLGTREAALALALALAMALVVGRRRRWRRTSGTATRRWTSSAARGGDRGRRPSSASPSSSSRKRQRRTPTPPQTPRRPRSQHDKKTM